MNNPGYMGPALARRYPPLPASRTHERDQPTARKATAREAPDSRTGREREQRKNKRSTSAREGCKEMSATSATVAVSFFPVDESARME